MKRFGTENGPALSTRTETAIRLLAIESVPRRASWRRASRRRATGWSWLLLAAGPLAWLFQRWTTRFPDKVESWYAQGFYPAVVGAWSRFTGLVPFSIMEMIVILLAIAIPFLLFFWIRGIVRAPSHVKWRTAIQPAGHLLLILSVWYAISIPMWNLNYNRPTFLTLSSMTTAPSDTETLLSATLWLADEANTLRDAVLEDEDGVMRLRYNTRDSLDKSSSGYDILSNRFSFLAGEYGRPKPVLLSRLMSWTRIIGLYTVTTAEANIDVDMTDVEIPFTALHEMAHQRGIAREDEANAVAWFASRVHPDPDHRYSGAVQAYLYAANALHGVDPEAWNTARSHLSAGVMRDLQAQSAYWARFDSIVDKVAEKANDAWLKSNGQTDGVRSYGRMVDIMLAEYQRLVAAGDIP